MILSKKQILLVGGTKLKRKNTVSLIVENSKYAVYRFPLGMKSLYDYLDFVRKKQLFVPWYESRAKYGTDQLIDFHLDWISENEVLIVIEEIEEFEEGWKLEILCWYLEASERHKKGEKFSRLLLTQEKEDDLIGKLSKKIRIKNNYNRTTVQIVENNLKIYDLTE